MPRVETVIGESCTNRFVGSVHGDISRPGTGFESSTKPCIFTEFSMPINDAWSFTNAKMCRETFRSSMKSIKGGVDERLLGSST